MFAPSGSLEWLSTNRRGSFALGCVDRRLRRKYATLLTVREPGHGDPWNVLAEMHERLDLGDERSLLCDVLHGDPQEAALASFVYAPHPTHRYRLRGVDIERSLALSPDHDQVELTYRVRGLARPARLVLEPLLLCRPVHELTRENPFLDGSLTQVADELRMLPYAGMPGLALRVHGATGRWVERGTWYTRIDHAWETERGYDSVEDLFSPGEIVVELAEDADFTVVLGLEHTVAPSHPLLDPAPSSFGAKLEWAAEQFFMHTRGGAWSIVAGFPWFGPWGRDTLIALPGLHLATGDFERTAAVLETMLASRVNGLIPNIPALSAHESANTSSADASLLFARTVQWLGVVEGSDRVERFMRPVCELLEALAESRDPRITLDDGIGVFTQRGPWALTWMDAVIDERPVTPRAGYAIELDALAYNAARFALAWGEGKHGAFTRAFKKRMRDAESRFLARYWDDTRGYLADAHDGVRADGSLRPNQLWALGLPFRPVPAEVARASLEAVTRELFTPAGLRTLSPRDPSYRGQYGGTQLTRDLAYHQGTVWPWLLGIYADAVRASRGREALESALSAALTFHARHLEHEGCLGQVSEVFSGDAPHVAGGAPAQAWSVAELYRVWRMLHSSA